MYFFMKSVDLVRAMYFPSFQSFLGKQCETVTHCQHHRSLQGNVNQLSPPHTTESNLPKTVTATDPNQKRVKRDGHLQRTIHAMPPPLIPTRKLSSTIIPIDP